MDEGFFDNFLENVGDSFRCMVTTAKEAEDPFDCIISVIFWIVTMVLGLLYLAISILWIPFVIWLLFQASIQTLVIIGIIILIIK